MIKEKLGDRLDGWIHAAVPFLFRRPVNPNILTLTGALVSLGAAVAFGYGWFVAGSMIWTLSPAAFVWMMRTFPVWAARGALARTIENARHRARERWFMTAS